MENVELILTYLFRLNAEIPAEVIAEMQKRIKVEQACWKKRTQKLELGGHSSRKSKSKKKPWHERRITKAEKAALAAGWAEYDAKKAALQGQ